MQRSSDYAQPNRSELAVLAAVGAVVLGLVAVGQPNVAVAGTPGAGGGFHGGGGMATAGGFHGGGFSGLHGGAGALHTDAGHIATGALHTDAGHIGAAWHGGIGGGSRDGDGGRHEGGWDHRQGGWGQVGVGLPYYSYTPNAYGYDFTYSQSPVQSQYYCADPPGYYPDVTQCPAGWQVVPAS
jgi:hypothetical protein